MSDRAFERITGDMARVPANATLELSPLQFQILRQLAEGMRYEEIAQELGIAHDTLRGYQKQTFRKLGAQNAPHAVAIGFRTGILE